ncbi:hypothetical protein [Roseibium sp. RKSG952]|uniref:hypothetical protein n=1 Tax=Roseibium sp. RKSG952 TaxID=2529384 RepID=UPI0012BC9679|nr:hypothetical protein [Roseibium sp. RKSG952]MTH94696.1 hypothetical protein [Roseibium sp. RKSG952]
MSDWLDYLSRLSLGKIVIIILFALLGSRFRRDNSWGERAVTIICGVLAAVVFAEPLRLLLGWGADYESVVAAALALTGRNWAVYAFRASKDPAAAREIKAILRGKGK